MSSVDGIRNVGVSAEVDNIHKALRTSVRPADKGVYGSYGFGLSSGVVAAGMTGPLAIAEMRWFPTAGVSGLVRRVRFSAAGITLFAAGVATFSLFRATNFSVLDATGAVAAPTFAGKSGAKSTRMGPSQLQSATGQAFNVLSTANTGLTGGTKTLDNNPIGLITAGVPVTAGTGNTWIVPPGSVLWESSASDPEPIELQSNEGLVIRCEAIAATGTWTFSVDYDWAEADPTKYFI
jgi:hypothetical protein